MDLLALSTSENGKSVEQSFSALYLYNLERSVVLMEPSAGSVMLHGCRDCLVVLGCHQVSSRLLSSCRLRISTDYCALYHQFRMHNSTNCKILLQISGTPVIERCSRLLFGPYPPFLSVI